MSLGQSYEDDGLSAQCDLARIRAEADEREPASVDFTDVIAWDEAIDPGSNLTRNYAIAERVLDGLSLRHPLTVNEAYALGSAWLPLHDAIRAEQRDLAAKCAPWFESERT